MVSEPLSTFNASSSVDATKRTLATSDTLLTAVHELNQLCDDLQRLTNDLNRDLLQDGQQVSADLLLLFVREESAGRLESALASGEPANRRAGPCLRSQLVLLKCEEVVAVLQNDVSGHLLLSVFRLLRDRRCSPE